MLNALWAQIREHPWSAAVAATGGTLLTLWAWRKYRNATALLPEEPRREYKDGVIYVHVFPRWWYKNVINLSPYGIKLEMWLRWMKIDYEAVVTRKFSKSTSQIPYIIWNGKEFTDSNMIIAFMRKHHGLDPSEGLTSEQQGVSRAMIMMLEEHFAWAYRVYNYCVHTEEFRRHFRADSPSKMKTYHLRDWFGQMATGQGMMRHRPEVQEKMGCDDIRAVSMYLGEKTYLMGEKPTLVDFAAFGNLCQVVYSEMPSAFKKFIHSECHNIIPYLDRLKAEFWPDWDTLVPKGTFE